MLKPEYRLIIYGWYVCRSKCTDAVWRL